MYPLKAAMLSPAVVKIVEDLDGLLHLGAQVGVLNLVRGPEARGEHCDREVDAPQRVPALRQAVAVLPEVLLQVRGQGKVRDHALELRGELRAALHLQFRDHALLRVLRRRGLVQQSLGQLVPVDLGEEILVAQEGEELHHFLEELLNLVVGEPLARLLENPIAERGHESCEGVLADVSVDEHLEGLLQRLLEQRVLREALLHDALEALVEVQERLDEGRVAQRLRLRRHLLRLLHALVHDLVSPVGDVRAEGLRDGVQAVVHQGEHAVHPGQVISLVVVEEVDHAGLLFQQLLLRLREQRLDHDVIQLRLRRPVEVVRHTQLLGVERGLRLAQVLRERVLGDPARGLSHEVVARRRQERLLEFSVVHVGAAQAKVDEHIDDALNQILINMLALALEIDHAQQRVPGVLLALLEH
mmetsp:Transcript_75202/g.196032  ORF Transcript_75202/g.196032 Transcript_75202/m.196032 type:complete len:415 (+) Transcript_75202:781-2025(+)